MLFGEMNLGLEKPARKRWQKTRLDAPEWTGFERRCSEYRWILVMGKMRCPSKWNQNGRLTSSPELPEDAPNCRVQGHRKQKEGENRFKIQIQKKGSI